jgi:hypothetical protein
MQVRVEHGNAVGNLILFVSGGGGVGQILRGSEKVSLYDPSHCLISFGLLSD